MPEFEPRYLALCRELRLEREIRAGDCIEPGVWQRLSTGVAAVTMPSRGLVAPALCTWLPQLADWVELLQRDDPRRRYEGRDDLVLCWLADIAAHGLEAAEFADDPPSPELAAASLYLVVVESVAE